MKLELWTYGARVMLRDPTTGQTREMTPVAFVTFADGSVFPPDENDPARDDKPESKTIRTLSGQTLNVG